MSKVVEVNDQSFENEIIKSSMPVVVDFWAPWCGPCHMIAPVTEKLSDEYADRVKFSKLNVDENPETSQRYGVMSIPMLIFFKDGQQVDSVLGAVPESTLQPKVRALL